MFCELYVIFCCKRRQIHEGKTPLNLQFAFRDNVQLLCYLSKIAAKTKPFAFRSSNCVCHEVLHVHLLRVFAPRSLEIETAYANSYF